MKMPFLLGAVSYYEELTNILNCVNYGSVRGTSAIGGVVGNIHGGRVFNSANFGSVTAPSHVGGIVGKNTDDCGSIRNCYNAGTVTGSTNDYVGAINHLLGRFAADEKKAGESPDAFLRQGRQQMPPAGTFSRVLKRRFFELKKWK